MSKAWLNMCEEVMIPLVDRGLLRSLLTPQVSNQVWAKAEEEGNGWSVGWAI